MSALQFTLLPVLNQINIMIKLYLKTQQQSFVIIKLVKFILIQFPTTILYFYQQKFVGIFFT